MTNKLLQKIIKQIFKKIFKIDINKISTKSSSKTISNWDSISHLNLIIEVEKKFKIKIKPDEAFKLDSYEAIFKYLKKNIAK